MGIDDRMQQRKQWFQRRSIISGRKLELYGGGRFFLEALCSLTQPCGGARLLLLGLCEISTHLECPPSFFFFFFLSPILLNKLTIVSLEKLQKETLVELQQSAFQVRLNIVTNDCRVLDLVSNIRRQVQSIKPNKTTYFSNTCLI